MVARSARLAARRRVILTHAILSLALLAGLVSAAAAEPSQVYLIVLRDQPVHELSPAVGEPYRARVAELQRRARAVMIQGSPAARQELAGLNAAADATLDAMRQAILSAAESAVAQSQAPVVGAVRSAGGEVIYQYRAVNALAARLPAGAVAALEARPDVAAVYPDEKMSAQLNISAAAIGAGTWWANSETGGVWDVGVVDSGVDINHPDFVSHTRISARFLATAEAAGWDPSHDPSPDDVNGHGSNVAGITSSGNSVYQGVAFGHDKLFNLKAGYDGDGADGGPAYMTWSDAMAAVDWAFHQSDSPDVLNLSYGACASSDDHGFSRFWDAVVDDLDTSVAISAGNSAATCIHYPSTAYNVISAANADDHSTVNRSDDTINPSSSRGPVPVSGRRKPDLAAPGTGIMAANNTWDEGDSWWAAYTGTSQAAPHVAGALLLTLDGGLYSPRAQKALLINSAEDRGDSGWDASWGWGYLNLARAYDDLDYVNEERVDAAPDHDLFVGPVSAGDTATLVWNRHVAYGGAAYPPAGSAYGLNDLDLYLYNAVTNALMDSSLSAFDNVEQVEASASVTGVLRVQTFSSDLNGVDSEPYALATEGEFSQVTGPELETSDGRAYFVEPGESVTFTLSVTNAGDLTLHAVQVTIAIPFGVLLTDGVNPVAMGNLAPGGSQSATWVFQKVTDQVLRTIIIDTAGQGYGLSFGSQDLVRLIKPPGFFIPLVMRD
jgi:serine protease AprX